MRRVAACVLAITALVGGCTDANREPLREIDLSDASGGAPPTDSQGPAVISNDTAAIVFVSDRSGGGLQLFAIDPDGSGEQQLTDDAANFVHPTWSPDGERLAYVRAAPGNLATSASELFVLDAEGHRMVETGRVRDNSPVWSPDGRSLAFESETEGSAAIWTIDEGGGTPVRLTHGPLPAYQPEWSPDGTRIAFAVRTSGCTGEQVLCEQHIWVMEVDGSNPVQLTFGSSHDGEPAWSPDGRTIAFSSNGRGVNFDVWVMDDRGSDPTRLTHAPGLDLNASWSPDGRFLAFMSTRDGDPDIYVMDADGTHQRNITQNSGTDFTPTWRPAHTSGF